jgi:hypothetical protein
MALFAGENPSLGNQATANGLKIDATERVNVSGLSATSATQTIFIADIPMTVTGIQVVYGVTSSSGTLQLSKDTGITAPGAGTSLLSATVNLAGTANTVIAGALVTTSAVNMAAGDRLALVLGGTLTGLANGQVIVTLKRT